MGAPWGPSGPKSAVVGAVFFQKCHNNVHLDSFGLQKCEKELRLRGWDPLARFAPKFCIGSRSQCPKWCYGDQFGDKKCDLGVSWGSGLRSHTLGAGRRGRPRYTSMLRYTRGAYKSKVYLMLSSRCTSSVVLQTMLVFSISPACLCTEARA